MKQLIAFFYILSLLALVACNGGMFSEQAPFAVMAQRFRHYPDAKLMANRLEEMGLDPYIMGYEPKGEGHWYGVFLGASETLEEMVQNKMDYEEQHGLRGLDRVNYNQISSTKFEISSEDTYSPKERPLPLPAQMRQVIEQLPHVPSLRMTGVKLAQSLDSTDIYLLKPVREMSVEFPKNVNPNLVEQASEAVAQAIYEDFLFAKRVQLTAAKLRQGNPFGDNPAQAIAETIMGSRNYENDQMQQIETNNAAGYLVTLIPRPDRIRHYVVLFNKTTNMLVLGESADSEFSQEDWKRLVPKIGGSEHLGYYYHLQEGVKRLPASVDNDQLAFLQLSFRQDSKGTGAGRYRGHRQLDAIFCQSKTQYWAVEGIQLVHASDAGTLYEKAFVEAKHRVKPDSINIAGFKGLLRQEKRAVSVKRKLQYQQAPTGIDLLADKQLLRFYFASGGYTEEGMRSKVRAFVQPPK